ncbi:MAG: ScpA family protein [Gammaproteobacteria bacterium]|jgi:segregation and condensation protein A
MSEVIARVLDKPYTEMPQDLYIPPDALRVFLDAFEGPLDLLLYLIRRHNLEILDIPIAEITKQYMQYIALMNELRLELAGEYLVMAATLAEIKSRLLLPRPPVTDSEDEGIDPREQLMRQLQLYEQFKRAAEDLDQIPRMERDIFPVHVEIPELEIPTVLPQTTLKELVVALQTVLARAEQFSHHHVMQELMTVRQAMTHVLEKINADQFTEFSALFKPESGRLGIIVTFLAILELLKEAMLELSQASSFAPIYLRAIPEHD